MTLESRLAHELIRRDPARSAAALEHLGVGEAARLLDAIGAEEAAPVLAAIAPHTAAAVLERLTSSRTRPPGSPGGWPRRIGRRFWRSCLLHRRAPSRRCCTFRSTPRER
jgi:hypothetical protein